MDGAVDAYAVLGVSADADSPTVRAAYLHLARTVSVFLIQHHPDKSAHADTEDRIRLINAAYETLRDPSLHAAYKARRASYLAQHEQARMPRIADTVDVDALDAQGEGDDVHFVYPCRCGQQYVLTPAEIADGHEHVACTGCSEVIRVVYDSED